MMREHVAVAGLQRESNSDCLSSFSVRLEMSIPGKCGSTCTGGYLRSFDLMGSAVEYRMCFEACNAYFNYYF